MNIHKKKGEARREDWGDRTGLKARLGGAEEQCNQGKGADDEPHGFLPARRSGEVLIEVHISDGQARDTIP